MSKELHIALQEAIGDLGTDVLKSPLLVNILQDYGAFDVHDKDISLKKEIILALVTSGYGDKLSQWKKKPDWESENNKYISCIKKKQSFDEETLCEISNAFICAVGLKVKTTQQKTQNNKQNKQQSQKPNIVALYITKAKTHIPRITDRKKFLRVILYIISAWNVIQLLAAVEKVTTWGVWDWGILFDIIGVLIGTLGVVFGILLPAFGLSWLFYAIEEDKSVNYKKTNIVLFILNLIGISGLFVLSKMTYTISKSHYSNFSGSYTEYIDVAMWSWHHVWLILRPLVYVLIGIVVLVIALLILLGIGWLLVQTGRTLIKYFTT